MQYIEISNKTVQEVVDSIKEVAPNHGFGVQHIHNIKETLNSKGKELDAQCQVIDICNPNVAETFLNEDISLACIMPCKIANSRGYPVYRDPTGNVSRHKNNIRRSRKDSR